MTKSASLTPYEVELAQLEETLKRAAAADIAGLKTAIAGACEASIIAVGSGGSYTVAALLCSLHEHYTGRVSRAVTPLELICNPTLSATSPIFIISAEGKNPDIIEALSRARQHSSRAVHVVTNRSSSPLMERTSELHDVTAHVFELSIKDGYLATNSLVLDAALIARAFEELDTNNSAENFDIDLKNLKEILFRDWLDEAAIFAREACSKKGIIIVFSPRLRAIAEDLESKLSESALLFSQLADFRSFAHGRHLWLTDRAEDSALLVLTEPSTNGLWANLQTQLPSNVASFALPLPGSAPRDLLVGLIAAMHLISQIANEAKRNIAKPAISALGRQLYYADLAKLIPAPTSPIARGEHSKYDVLGAHWPAPRKSGRVKRAREATEALFERQVFRAIVFDYDGTLCSSSGIDKAPSAEVIMEITRLLSEGAIIGIATGRGGSIIEHFRNEINESLWPRLRLGLYNGGWIGQLDQTPAHGTTLSEFLLHAKRIIMSLRSYGVPIKSVGATPPFQLSVRFHQGVSTDNMWFVIADALKQAGLDTGTILRSKHSIDILSKGVSKSHVIASIVKGDKLDPYEVVAMGDLGAWPGNDSSLLQHQFSLSVDLPSRRLDRGWKLAPQHTRDVDATLWYLRRLVVQPGGGFKFQLAREF